VLTEHRPDSVRLLDLAPSSFFFLCPSSGFFGGSASLFFLCPSSGFFVCHLFPPLL
jgi:hypothetical protein